MEENLFQNELKEIESDKQKLAFDVDKLIEAVRQGNVYLVELQQKLNDAQWLLGEEKARREHFEQALAVKQQDLEKMRQDFARLNQSYDESQWYLGEERSKREHSSGSLQAAQQRCLELEAQLNELRGHYSCLQKELADTRWYLEEERAKQGSR